MTTTLPPPAPMDPGHPQAFSGTYSLGDSGQIDAEGVCAWFSGRLVLETVNLTMEKSKVTALIGPSGCGKSTYLRILNRMHESCPVHSWPGGSNWTAWTSMGLDYGPWRPAHIGMVFQKPNPFPAMTIAENVLAGLKFSRMSPVTRTTWSRSRSPKAACGTRSRTASAS